MLYNSILETIGNTPLVKLNKIKELYKLEADIYAKVESFNPGGSVKDRVAFKMIEEGLRQGVINQETKIIEATSGNTGIGLAMVGAYLDLDVIIVMPDSMSIERQKLIKGFGATLVLTDGTKGMSGSIEKANELKELYGNAIIASQFDNPNNPLVHYVKTGKEIYEDLNDIDIFVTGIGTGGTISGIGKYLKEKKNIQIYGVEPYESSVISGFNKGAHGIQGIGAGFIPDNLNLKIIDGIIRCKSNNAIDCSKILIKKEGILAGISSGASLYGAIELAKDPSNKGKRIVCLLPDTGERYLSCNLFKEEIE